MPYVVPTKAEIEAMPPLKRQKARRAVAAMLRDIGTDLDRATVSTATTDADAHWGITVRAKAWLLQDDMPTEAPHVIRERRAIALLAVYGDADE